MWQRKQTIFLTVTSACMVLMIFFPAWEAIADGVKKTLYPLQYTVQANGAENIVYYPYALSAIFAVAAATVAIMEIGKFENRMLQLKLGTLNTLLMAGSMISLVYFATELIKVNQQAGHYGLAIWLPGIAMVSNLIANRFIRSDEKLVKDSERIR